MARVLITTAMGAMLAATGCSSTQRARVDYPPAQLVHDAPAVTLAPSDDGQGAMLGVDVGATWFETAVRPDPAEHWATSTALAIPRVVGGAVGAAGRNPVKAALVAAGGYVAVRAAQGKLDDDFDALQFWESDEPEKDPKGFKKRSPILTRPEGVTSHQQLLATRDSCQFLGSSSHQPTLDATFGSSGSSACHIDLKPAEEHAE